MKDRILMILLLATFGFAIWLDNHPPTVPDLTPHIDRVMDWIAP